jgi:hypothetical protein
MDIITVVMGDTVVMGGMVVTEATGDAANAEVIIQMQVEPAAYCCNRFRTLFGAVQTV